MDSLDVIAARVEGCPPGTEDRGDDGEQECLGPDNEGLHWHMYFPGGDETLARDRAWNVADVLIVDRPTTMSL